MSGYLPGGISHSDNTIEILKKKYFNVYLLILVMSKRMAGAWRSEALDLPELELKSVVSHSVGGGNWTPTLWDEQLVLLTTEPFPDSNHEILNTGKMTFREQQERVYVWKAT